MEVITLALRRVWTEFTSCAMAIFTHGMLLATSFIYGIRVLNHGVYPNGVFDDDGLIHEYHQDGWTRG